MRSSRSTQPYRFSRSRISACLKFAIWTLDSFTVGIGSPSRSVVSLSSVDTSMTLSICCRTLSWTIAKDGGSVRLRSNRPPRPLHQGCHGHLEARADICSTLLDIGPNWHGRCPPRTHHSSTKDVARSVVRMAQSWREEGLRMGPWRRCYSILVSVATLQRGQQAPGMVLYTNLDGAARLRAVTGGRLVVQDQVPMM